MAKHGGVSKLAVPPCRRTGLTGRSFTVLYVEDDSESRLLVRRVLQAEGYNMLEAKDAADGLASAKEQRPDLILVDINLPEVDGLTLARQIKAVADLASTPVVALTANVMRGDRERSLGAGCDGYIQKPIDVDLLPRQISGYLRKRI
jgi:two-component system cell cycle response regulator DivK